MFISTQLYYNAIKNDMLANRIVIVIICFLLIPFYTFSQSSDEYIMRGNEYRSNGQLEKAIIEYNNALKINNRHADAFFERGIAKAFLSDMEGAVHDLKEGLNIKSSAEKYYLLAVYQQYLPNVGEDILFSLNMAIELNSVEKTLNDSKLYAFRGQTQANIFENYDAAIRDYTIAIEHASHDEVGLLYEQRAQIREAMSDYSGALLDYNLAIKAIPWYSKDDITSQIIYSNCYYSRGNIHLKLNSYKLAADDFTTAIQYSSGSDSRLFLSRAKAKHLLLDYQGAIRDYSEAIDIRPSDAEAYFQRGNVRMDLKEYIASIQDFTKSIEIEKDAYTYANRGIAKEHMNDFRGAISDYNQAISINPENGLFYSFRAAAKISLKDYFGAVNDSNVAIKQDPQDAYAYEYRGLAKIHLGKINEGCLDLSRAGELGSRTAYDLIKEYCR